MASIMYAYLNSLADVNNIPLTPPNVLNDTATGMRKATVPNILLPNVTATARELNSSYRDSTAKYAKLTKTYIIVTIGIAIQMALGRFLQNKFTNFNILLYGQCRLTHLYGSCSSSVTKFK